jgi:hypothetical protein
VQSLLTEPTVRWDAHLCGLGSLQLCPSWLRFAWPINAHEPSEHAASLPACLLHGTVGYQLGPGEADAQLGVHGSQRPVVQFTAEVPVNI